MSQKAFAAFETNEAWATELLRHLAFDAATGLFTWASYPSGRATVGDVAGSLNSAGYRYIVFRGRKIAAHRLIWFLTRGEMLPPSQPLDHANGARGDNRPPNLRRCTPAQNGSNRAKNPAARSQYKGVRWMPKGRKHWQADIRRDGKSRFLGVFDTEEEAALAYDEAARKVYGEFARPNFPETRR